MRRWMKSCILEKACNSPLAHTPSLQPPPPTPSWLRLPGFSLQLSRWQWREVQRGPPFWLKNVDKDPLLLDFWDAGSCGSLQQCINTILQRFGNMIRCFFITTYLMFFEQLLKIENFQTKQQCFQHPMRGKWNFYSYETLNLIPQQNIWRQQIFFEIRMFF